MLSLLAAMAEQGVIVVVPDPVHTQNAIGNWCKRQFVNNTEVKWYPSRGKQPCDRLDGPDDKRISTVRHFICFWSHMHMSIRVVCC